MTGTAYLLTLTEQDIETIASNRTMSFWASSLRYLIAGDNVLAWKETRAIRDSVEKDMIEGREAYAGLPPDSTLCTKLHNLYQSII